MACWIESGLRVRVCSCEARTCNPKPSDAGIQEGEVLRVFGLVDHSDTSEAYFLVFNDRGEPWFLPTRHFRLEGSCR